MAENLECRLCHPRGRWCHVCYGIHIFMSLTEGEVKGGDEKGISPYGTFVLSAGLLKGVYNSATR